MSATLDRVLLIDADVLCFQAASAVEVTTHWGEDLWTLHSDLGTGKIIADGLIHKWKEVAGCSSEHLAWSCPSKRYWRHEILPTYKANRSKTNGRKPIVYKELRAYLQDTYPSTCYPALEADDVLGILATGPLKKKKEPVVCTIDKDLRQVPGRHYNPDTGEEFRVSKAQGDRWHLEQALMGDPVDGYSGCPKVGPKTAIKILDKAGDDPWPVIVEEYGKQGLSEQEALIQAQVARILQAGEWGPKKGVVLWSPYV